MTILVDQAIFRSRALGPNRVWCHMVTDSDDIEELHAMAEAIGLRRDWFQKDHYDLTPPKRRAAIARGAVAVDSIELVERMKPRRPAIAKMQAEQEAKGERQGWEVVPRSDAPGLWR